MQASALEHLLTLMQRLEAMEFLPIILNLGKYKLFLSNWFGENKNCADNLGLFCWLDNFRI